MKKKIRGFIQLNDKRKIRRQSQWEFRVEMSRKRIVKKMNEEQIEEYRVSYLMRKN